MRIKKRASEPEAKTAKMTKAKRAQEEKLGFMSVLLVAQTLPTKLNRDTL